MGHLLPRLKSTETTTKYLFAYQAGALAALADPASTQGGTSGTTSGHHHHHHHQPPPTPVSLASSGGVTARLELVDRGQGPLEREKVCWDVASMDYKYYPTPNADSRGHCAAGGCYVVCCTDLWGLYLCVLSVRVSGGTLQSRATILRNGQIRG